MSSQAEKDLVRLRLHPVACPGVFLELGAHVGEEAEWLLSLGPRKYVMVEPDYENYLKIQSKSWPLSVGVHIVRCAVASFNGHTDFYESVNHTSNNRASGSIRNPEGHLKHFPEVTFKKSTAPCRTLDWIAENEQLDTIDLLWCDIQGAERDMIEGGRATLAKTRYMMIEAEPEVELYEGQALKPELIAMLPDWEIIKDFGYNLFMVNRKFNAQPI